MKSLPRIPRTCKKVEQIYVLSSSSAAAAADSAESPPPPGSVPNDSTQNWFSPESPTGSDPSPTADHVPGLAASLQRGDYYCYYYFFFFQKREIIKVQMKKNKSFCY